MKNVIYSILFLILLVSLAHADCDGLLTPNRGVCKPNHGSYVNNWEVPVNANYDLLDFSCVTPLSCSGTPVITLNTVPMSKGGTGQTTNTKGDILVGTGSGWAKVGVGTNGQTIVADSTQSSGMKWGNSGSAASAPFTDTTSIVKGSTDPTKKVRIEVDGLTSGVTRVITMPDEDVTLGGGGGGDSCTRLSGSMGVERTNGTDFYMSLSGFGTTLTTGDHFDLEHVFFTAGHVTGITCRSEINPGSTGGDGYDIKIYDDTHGTYSAPVCQLRGSTKTCTATADTATIPLYRGVEYYVAQVGSPDINNSIACATEFCP